MVINPRQKLHCDHCGWSDYPLSARFEQETLEQDKIGTFVMAAFCCPVCDVTLENVPMHASQAEVFQKLQDLEELERIAQEKERLEARKAKEELGWGQW